MPVSNDLKMNTEQDRLIACAKLLVTMNDPEELRTYYNYTEDAPPVKDPFINPKDRLYNGSEVNPFQYMTTVLEHYGQEAPGKIKRYLNKANLLVHPDKYALKSNNGYSLGLMRTVAKSFGLDSSDKSLKDSLKTLFISLRHNKVKNKCVKLVENKSGRTRAVKLLKAAAKNDLGYYFIFPDVLSNTFHFTTSNLTELLEKTTFDSSYAHLFGAVCAGIGFSNIAPFQLTSIPLGGLMEFATKFCKVPLDLFLMYSSGQSFGNSVYEAHNNIRMAKLADGFLPDELGTSSSNGSNALSYIMSGMTGCAGAILKYAAYVRDSGICQNLFFGRYLNSELPGMLGILLGDLQDPKLNSLNSYCLTMAGIGLSTLSNIRTTYCITGELKQALALAALSTVVIAGSMYTTPICTFLATNAAAYISGTELSIPAIYSISLVINAISGQITKSYMDALSQYLIKDRVQEIQNGIKTKYEILSFMKKMRQTYIEKEAERITAGGIVDINQDVEIIQQPSISEEDMLAIISKLAQHENMKRFKEFSARCYRITGGEFSKPEQALIYCRVATKVAHDFMEQNNNINIIEVVNDKELKEKFQYIEDYLQNNLTETLGLEPDEVKSTISEFYKGLLWSSLNNQSLNEQNKPQMFTPDYTGKNTTADADSKLDIINEPNINEIAVSPDVVSNFKAPAM